jgi:hypothetical protein
VCRIECRSGILCRGFQCEWIEVDGSGHPDHDRSVADDWNRHALVLETEFLDNMRLPIRKPIRMPARLPTPPFIR